MKEESKKMFEIFDKKQNFVRSILNNPETMHNVYFGLKAAPLTLAHEKIIQYLVDEFLKWDNVHLRIGIADSEWKKKFDLIKMVDEIVRNKYPNKVVDYDIPESEVNKPQDSNWWKSKIAVVNQDGWLGLFGWLKEERYNPEFTLVVVGADEANDLEHGKWADSLAFYQTYMFHVTDRNDGISASKVRDIFWRDPDVDYYCVKDLISKWTYDWIKRFGTFWQLKENYRAEENNFIEKYDPSAFERPSVTVDNVVWSEFNEKKYLLLIRRGGHPYKGFWALPGGFLDMNDENLESAARRELKEEAFPNLNGFETVQFKAYSDKGTDPRTRIVDVVFATKVDWITMSTAKAGDDAAELYVFPLDELPKLAFNHSQIVREYFESISN